MNYATVEFVLMLRIWVLYGRSKRVGTFMAVSFLVTIGVGLALRNVQPKVVAGDVFTRKPFPPFVVYLCSWFLSAGDCYDLQAISSV